MSPNSFLVLRLHAQDIRWDHEYQRKHGRSYKIPKTPLKACRDRRATTRGFFRRGGI